MGSRGEFVGWYKEQARVRLAAGVFDGLLGPGWGRAEGRRYWSGTRLKSRWGSCAWMMARSVFRAESGHA